jgi:hypothetical protein
MDNMVPLDPFADNMVTVDPFENETEPTEPALYGCWACPWRCG